MNAKRDNNRITTLTGVLNSDGSTITNVVVNASNHSMKVVNGTTGTDNGPGPRSLHDENHIPTATTVSSSDGSTIVPLYVDSSGSLLIQST